MLRGSFPGHRRYSITHRAVQRLRELVPTMEDLDDEALRDRLDETLGTAEDAQKAVRTLDAMLGEPQVLIPVDTFGELLYAIIKEDTVVTVLPQAHGQEILQRGQALEEKVANGDRVPAATYGSDSARERERATDRDRDDGGDRWDPPRRRWRRDPTRPVVIERAGGRGASPATNGRAAPSPASASTELTPPATPAASPSPVAATFDATPESVVALADKRRPEEPVAQALFDALERGKRRATQAAVREVVDAHDRSENLIPLWNELASLRVPETLTVGDLIAALAPLDG
ncbi:MAG: hypothetical protein B7733_22725 [Myxococcales bacterium FL481]|nr:MAG: hypothetical protein B7733_22725 [Myxococcales bacterium FL481]